jgi:hypothetical protein
MRNPKPKWWLLYAVIPLGAALFVAVDLLAPSAGWRKGGEGVAALAIIGVTVLWVRAHRLALALLGDRSGGEQSLRAWIAYRPPALARRSLGPRNAKSKDGESRAGLQGEEESAASRAQRVPLIVQS